MSCGWPRFSAWCGEEGREGGCQRTTCSKERMVPRHGCWCGVTWWAAAISKYWRSLWSLVFWSGCDECMDHSHSSSTSNCGRGGMISIERLKL